MSTPKPSRGPKFKVEVFAKAFVPPYIPMSPFLARFAPSATVVPPGVVIASSSSGAFGELEPQGAGQAEAEHAVATSANAGSDESLAHEVECKIRPERFHCPV